MAIINLRKHYYPLYTKDTFVEVPDEVAAVMEECRLYENRQGGQKSYYHVYGTFQAWSIGGLYVIIPNPKSGPLTAHKSGGEHDC